jgi:hypothetical protein
MSLSHFSWFIPACRSRELSAGTGSGVFSHFFIPFVTVQISSAHALPAGPSPMSGLPSRSLQLNVVVSAEPLTDVSRIAASAKPPNLACAKNQTRSLLRVIGDCGARSKLVATHLFYLNPYRRRPTNIDLTPVLPW